MTTRVQRGSSESVQTKILTTVNDPAARDAAGNLSPSARTALLGRIAEAGFSKSEADGARALAESVQGTPHAAIIDGIAKEVLGEYHDQGRLRRLIADLRDPPRAAKPSKDWVNHVPPPPSDAKVTEWVNIINGGQAKLQGTVNKGEIHHGFHAATVFAELSELTIYPNVGLPADARVGWLAPNADDPTKPVKQLGVTRASNGQGCPFLGHKEPDVRGLAFLSPTMSVTATNQGKGQHVKSAEEFVGFAQANVAATAQGHTGLLGTAINAKEVLGEFGVIDGSKVLARLGRDTTFPPDSLATTTFVGSVTRLGDYAAKIVYIPDPTAEGGTHASKSDPHYLSADASNRGAKKYICCVQLYTNEADTPMDDSTKPWKSPLIPVGEMVTRPLADATAQGKIAQLIELVRINPGNIDVGPAPEGRPELARPLVDIMSAPRKAIYDGSADYRQALTHSGSLALVSLLHAVQGGQATEPQKATFDALLGVVDRMNAAVAERDAGTIDAETAWGRIKALRLEVATHLSGAGAA